MAIAAPAFAAGSDSGRRSADAFGRQSAKTFSIEAGAGYTHVLGSDEVSQTYAYRYGEIDLRVGPRWGVGRARLGFDVLFRSGENTADLAGISGVSGTFDYALRGGVKQVTPYVGLTGDVIHGFVGDGYWAPTAAIGPELGVELRRFPGPEEPPGLKHLMLNLRFGLPLVFYSGPVSTGIRLMASLGFVF